MSLNGWEVLASRKYGDVITGLKGNVHYILEYNEKLEEFRLKEEIHNNSENDKCVEMNRQEAQEWYDKLPNKFILFPK